MDPNQQRNISIEEAVAGLVSEMPKAVQDFILGPKKDQISLELTQKYRLHADQAGEFQHSFLMMLLGVVSPEEFAASLQKEKVPQEVINGLITDINEKVFIPIQNQERTAPAELVPAPQRQTAPTGPEWVQVNPVPQASSAAPRPLAQTPMYTPPAPPPSVSAFNQPAPATNAFVPQAPPNVVLPGSIPPVPTPPPVVLPPQPNFQPQPIEFQQPQAQPAYVPPPAPPQQYVPPQPAPQYVPPAPSPIQQAPQSYAGEAVAMVRTMSADMEAAKRGQQPEPHFISIPHPAQVPAPQAQPQYAAAPQQQPAPTQQPQYAPQQTVSPQWSTPGPSAAPSPRPAPVAQPKPQYIRPYVPPTPRIAPRAAAVPGSGDPYREPVE